MFSKLVDPVTYLYNHEFEAFKMIAPFRILRMRFVFAKYTANYFGESTQFGLIPMIQERKFQIANK